MIKRIRKSLTAKVFCIIAASLIVVCLVICGLIMIFMPYVYTNTLYSDMTEELETLVASLQMESYSIEEIEEILDKTEERTGTSIGIVENGKVGGSSFVDYGVGQDADNPAYTGFGYGESMVISQTFVTSDGYTCTVVATGNASVVSKTSEILLRIMPYITVIIFALSFLAAFLCSRYMTKPILALSATARRMSGFDLAARHSTKRKDEIGVLSDSLNEMAESLERSITELRIANEALQTDVLRQQEQERQRRDFFGAVSHELKTPITILQGELEGMIYGVGRYRDRDKYLKHSLEMTRSMESLVKEILTISKMEDESFSVKKIKTDLSGLILEICDAFSELSGQKDISLNRDIAEDIYCMADESLIRKAVSNILSNAFSYSPDGAQVLVRLAVPDDRGVLVVENSDVNIDEKELERLFEPFYRIEKSRNRHSGGSGLGLYIVKTILALHGMEYRLENTDAGVRFSVFFDNPDSLKNT